MALRMLEAKTLRTWFRSLGLLLRLRRCPVSRQGGYQPELPRELIHRLWLVGQSSGKPMTKLLAEALENYLTVREQEPAQR